MAPSIARSFALTVTLAFAPALPAQRTAAPQDSLPRELVVALLAASGAGGRDLDIRAGVVDESLPRSLLREAVPLGRVATATRSTSVVYYPYSREATLDTIRTRLEREGFTEPTMLRPSPSRGGLSASSSAVSMGDERVGIALCGPTIVLTAATSVDPRNRTVVTLALQRDERTHDAMCGKDSPFAQGGMLERMTRSPLPPLPPPRGVRASSSGSSGSPADGGTQHQTLHGVVSVERLQAHYDSLFAAAGWTRVTGAREAAHLIVIHELRADDGRLWRATLTGAVDAANDIADIILLTRARREP